MGVRAGRADYSVSESFWSFWRMSVSLSIFFSIAANLQAVFTSNSRIAESRAASESSSDASSSCCSSASLSLSLMAS